MENQLIQEEKIKEILKRYGKFLKGISTYDVLEFTKNPKKAIKEILKSKNDKPFDFSGIIKIIKYLIILFLLYGGIDAIKDMNVYYQNFLDNYQKMQDIFKEYLIELRNANINIADLNLSFVEGNFEFIELMKNPPQNITVEEIVTILNDERLSMERYSEFFKYGLVHVTDTSIENLEKLHDISNNLKLNMIQVMTQVKESFAFFLSAFIAKKVLFHGSK